MQAATKVGSIFTSEFNGIIYLYVMLNLIITVLFLISVAIAAGSIMIASQLRSTYRIDSLSALLYMQAFYFMFGFYALWGQVIVVAYITPLVSGEMLNKIQEISVLLGSPFIVFGWLMFLKFISELVNLKYWKAFNSVFIISNFIFLLSVGIWNVRTQSIHTLDLLKFYFIISNFIYACIGAILIIMNKEKSLSLKIDRMKDLALGILIFMVCQNTTLLIYDLNLWLTLIFIFLFFAGTAFIPVFIKFNIKLRAKPITDNSVIVSFEGFCTKYEISPREKEIVREICNGLSNQQIADKLFISLQTVKDHTHRIYGKTLASGRTQLMKMVQEVSGK